MGNKVVYGNEARLNEFPFVVYYNNSNTFHTCTGSLIARRWILTAAHCLGLGTHVTLGDYTRPGIEGAEQVIEIAEEIPHPDYTATYDSVEDDIALIRLAEPADIRTEAVAKIAPLKSKAFLRKMLANRKKYQVLGWGAMKSENGYIFADKLQKFNLRFYSKDEAVEQGYGHLADTNGTLFTETVYEDECNRGSACYGDSGGPIVCRQKGTWVQTGIVSFGDIKNGCRSGTWVMADVQKHFSWIQSYIN